MAKANSIKVDKSTPLTTPQTMQQSGGNVTQKNSVQQNSQNTNPTQSTWNVDTRSLSQQFGDRIKADWKQAGEELRTGSWMSPNLMSEYKPNDTFERTAGGYNYGYDRSISQTNNQQGQYNALNNTGHVAGMPESNNQGLLYQQQETQKGKRLPMRPGILPEEEVATTQGVETPVQSEPSVASVGTAGVTGAVSTKRSSGTGTSTQQGFQYRNADVNFNQYGDDSSPANQSTAGGMYDKYTGEGVRTSNLGYDPNITTADLDPNYLYGENAKRQNSNEAGYIARRNDMIASALYNEGRTSKEDVLEFLANQPGWNDSTESDRFNTVESIWKRLGSIAEQNQTIDPVQSELSNAQPTYSDESLNNMQNDLNQSTAGTIYGKVTADQDNEISTLEDDNSVYKTMNESRIQAYKNLRGMDSQAIAAAVVSGAMAYDSQDMRDLMQYDPAKYEYVQQAIKQLRGQMNINTITSGEGTWNTTATNGSSSLANEKTDFATSNSGSGTSTAEILKNVNQTLNSNDAASTASEQMASIESDMATLQNRLKNLKSEANKVFKGDVPQYIVNAYIANRTAEIQDQLSILENRYNAAYSRYQNEWEQTKWAAEFDLKKQELELKKQSANLDDWATRQGIALKWADLNGTTNGVTPLSTLQAQEALDVLSDFSSSYATGSHGGQCGAFVKKYLASIGVNLPNMSKIESKMSLIDKSITDPSQGDIVIMDSTKYPQNGHMAIVESVDDDGTIHLLESNWNNDEKVHRRTISPNNSQILGYYRPTGGTSSTSTAGTQGGTWTRRDGEEFNLNNATTYNSLTYDQQNVVKGLLNLTINPATITKRQYGDDFEKIKSAVIEINPNWQESDYGQADKVKKEWNTSTKNGSNSRNGTAIATAKELYEMSDLLGNTKFTDWNSMMNYLKKKLSNENFIKFRVKLGTLASEYAGALKGNNAAPTEKEIEEARQQIAENLSGGGIRAAAIEMTKSLFNKNANEADNYRNVTLEKPNLIVTKDVADWMYDTAGITVLPDYYNYMPTSGWAVVSQANSNLSNKDMVTNIFS